MVIHLFFECPFWPWVSASAPLLPFVVAVALVTVSIVMTIIASVVVSAVKTIIRSTIAMVILSPVVSGAIVLRLREPGRHEFYSIVIVVTIFALPASIVFVAVSTISIATFIPVSRWVTTRPYRVFSICPLGCYLKGSSRLTRGGGE